MCSLNQICGSCGTLLGPSPGPLATGNGDGKKQRSVHFGAFDLYYLDQRSNDYICVKDYNKGQRCKKGQFNPIGETASEPGTHRTEAVKGYKHRTRTRDFPSPVSDYSVRSGGQTLLESDNSLQFLTVPAQNSSQGYTLEEPFTPNVHSAQIYIHPLRLLSHPGSDAVTDLVPSYHRTSNFIFFFSSSISTIVYLHLYTTLFTEHPL